MLALALRINMVAEQHGLCDIGAKVVHCKGPSWLVFSSLN